MDDLVVDIMAKMWILVSYSCKKCFVKVKKKVWALQKYLSEGCIKGDFLLKKWGWSDLYLDFYGWFSGLCYRENLNFDPV